MFFLVRVMKKATMAAKLIPGKQWLTPIEGGPVEGIHRLGPFPAQRLVAVEIGGEAKQGLGKVAVNTRVASFVGVGEGARHNLDLARH